MGEVGGQDRHDPRLVRPRRVDLEQQVLHAVEHGLARRQHGLLGALHVELHQEDGAGRVLRREAAERHRLHHLHAARRAPARRCGSTCWRPWRRTPPVPPRATRPGDACARRRPGWRARWPRGARTWPPRARASGRARRAAPPASPSRTGRCWRRRRSPRADPAPPPPGARPPRTPARAGPPGSRPRRRRAPGSDGPATRSGTGRVAAGPGWRARRKAGRRTGPRSTTRVRRRA